MYIISFPVSASAEDYFDDRLDRARDCVRDLLDNQEIADAILGSDICQTDLADAYVALADASFSLNFVLDTFGSEMMPEDLSELRALAAIAKCANTEVEKVENKLIAERLGVEV